MSKKPSYKNLLLVFIIIMTSLLCNGIDYYETEVFGERALIGQYQCIFDPHVWINVMPPGGDVILKRGKGYPDFAIDFKILNKSAFPKNVKIRKVFIIKGNRSIQLNIFQQEVFNHESVYDEKDVKYSYSSYIEVGGFVGVEFGIKERVNIGAEIVDEKDNKHYLVRKIVNIGLAS